MSVQRIAALLQAKKDAEGANTHETVFVKQLGRGETKVLEEKRNFARSLAGGTRTVRVPPLDAPSWRGQH